MGSDTESGTSTVLISGKTVNIKNKSDLSKTSGTEAGCAAKKGVVTSRNTGKEYFNSWSTDVKFEGEPVIRMTDLATNNHGSYPGNTPTWPHLTSIKPGGIDCQALFVELKIALHQHDTKAESCDYPNTKHESEHMLGNAHLQNRRKSPPESIAGFKNYTSGGAPCLCMKGPSHGNVTEHAKKTRKQEAFKKSLAIKDSAGNVTGYRQPTVKECVDSELASIREDHDQIRDVTPKEKQDQVMECLEAVIYDHLERVSDPKKTKAELEKTELRVPGEGPFVPPPTATPGF
jgi:hypothetical protein